MKKRIPKSPLFLLLPFLLLIFSCVGINKNHASGPIYVSEISSPDEMDRIQIGSWHFAKNFICITEDGSKNTFLTWTENGETKTSKNYSTRTNIFAVHLNKKGIPNKMGFTIALVDEQLLNDAKLNTEDIVVGIDKDKLYRIKKFKKRINGQTITFEWDTKISTIISQAKKGKNLHVGIVVSGVFLHCMYDLKDFNGALNAAATNS